MSFQQEFAARLRAAGVVGAGGAGFPAYVKAGGRAEFVLVNAAECEPLLKKDQKLLELHAEKVFDGLELMMKAVGASAGVFGIKRKHEKLVKRLEEIARNRRDISVGPMGDYYPAGDEQCLVAELTGRIVPAGGIPLDVGCVVSNVETLYNAARAGETPVVEKWITVAGAVRTPATFKVPVGVTYAEAVELCGGATAKDPVGIDGGPMMGKVIPDFSTLINRASGGLIVLPREHPLVQKKAQPRAVFSRIGRSACDQCSFCTEFCPRYLLGHPIEPHKAMRSLEFTMMGESNFIGTQFCCECNLCSMMACPEDLDPKNVCTQNKRRLAAEGRKWEVEANPVRAELHLDNRRVPIGRLIRKLGLFTFVNKARRVVLPLKQHVGAPAEPTVGAGDMVKLGDVVAKPTGGKLGAVIHASIAGRVKSVDGSIVIEA
jgi:Na+-translocating ferredoxin:NAD+ oxidoreductase RnfC subunit